MRRVKKFFVALVIITPLALSQESNERRNPVIDTAIPPETIADSVIEFTSSKDMALNIPLAGEQILDGEVVLQAGSAPTEIVVPAYTMILPLESGVPVRMFLKRFQDRDVHYPIAIFPL